MYAPGMEKVTVTKADLIETVRRNREEHRSQFIAAQERYREAMIAELDRALQEAREGRKIRRAFSLPVPEDYTSSYDTALEMLAWEVGDEVTLDKRSFEELVLNKWAWHQQFAANTQSYLAE